MNHQLGIAPEGERPTEYLPVSPPRIRHSRWIQWTFVPAFLAFALIFAFADMHELWLTVIHADPWLMSLPVLCVAISYLTMAQSYKGISVAAGFPVPLWDMLKITFVANTVNYLVSTGGISGFAARMYFFTQRMIPLGTAVIISLAQTFLTNATLLLFLIAGFTYLFRVHTLRGPALVLTSALLVVFAAAAVIAGLLLLHPGLRRRTLFWLAQAAHWLLHRLWPHRAPARTHIWRYQFNLNRGITFLLSRKRQMVVPLFYIIIDWIFTVLVLYSAFLAVRYPVSIAYVMVGFSVGFILSFASLIPGGLGVMEGSMAAVFAGLGVPFETAVVAVLLFRAAYYLLPLLVSLFFLHGMFVQGTHVAEERVMSNED